MLRVVSSCKLQDATKLREELHKAFPDGEIDLETVDNLPYLNALLTENGRVHTSIRELNRELLINHIW